MKGVAVAPAGPFGATGTLAVVTGGTLALYFAQGITITTPPSVSGARTLVVSNAVTLAFPYCVAVAGTTVVCVSRTPVSSVGFAAPPTPTPNVSVTSSRAPRFAIMIAGHHQ